MPPLPLLPEAMELRSLARERCTPRRANRIEQARALQSQGNDDCACIPERSEERNEQGSKWEQQLRHKEPIENR
jgi:hypothetical protein